MDQRPSYRGKLIYAAQLLALSAAYVALGRLGLVMASFNRFAALVWPSTGLALAALTLGGYRLWPGIAVGAFATNLWSGAPPLVAFAVAVGNTSEAVVGAFALRRFPGFDASLARFRDIVALAVLAGMASTVISATIGVASLVLSGRVSPADFGRAWVVWWTGNLLGDLIVAPLLLTWASTWRVASRPAALAEAAALGAVLSVSAALVFIQRPEAVVEKPILLPYVLFLPLIWAALRFGVRGAATGMFVVAFAAVLGTYTGHGIFVCADWTDSLFALHAFLVAAALATLLIGSLVCELRESEERQRIAVEAAHLGVWFWNLKTDRLVWTPACKSMHGIDPDEEVSYGRFLETLHPDDREETQRATRQALEKCTDYWVEHRVLWPDGSLHWISGTGRVLCDEACEPYRMVGVSLDITAHKRADQERAELLLRERAARAEAQAATHAKDEFLAVLSHELRAPLQSMLGWTRMLRAPGVDMHKVQKGLETIERNVKLQGQLIEDLLDVSRIVAGKLQLAQERVDLADIIASAIESAKVAAQVKSIEVNATIAPLGGDVLGDPGRLLQVVSNLLLNAVKFTPDGGHIRVRLDREASQARIMVQDTGRGISPELLPYIFDRFRQAESRIGRPHDGLGLGLTIVRHLVELHGGTVKAESPGEGQGATLTVRLPLAF